MKFRDFKLSIKVLLISSLVMVVLGLLLGWMRYDAEVNLLLEAANRRNETLRHLLEDHIKGFVKKGQTLEEAVKDPDFAISIQHIPGTKLIEITDSKGVVWASNQKFRIGKPSFDQGEIQEVAKRKEVHRSFFAFLGKERENITSFSPFDRRQKVQELISPILRGQKVIGVIHIYLILPNFPQELREAAISSAFVTLGVVFVGGLLLWALIFGYIQQPITEVTQVAERISKGNLVIRAPVHGRDEIGELATSFNEMTEALIRMEFKADTDGLTGLRNYRHFIRHLDASVKLAQRYKRFFSLGLLDLDYFKEVNDTFGHLKGDEVLREVAGFLSKSIRTVDYIARYGGEEFVMIFPETTYSEAAQLCERLKEQLPQEIQVGNDTRVSVHASVGIADFPFCGEDRESLVAAADSALLFAKKSGRNQVAYFGALAPQALEEEDLERLYRRLRYAHLRAIEALAAAIDVKYYGGGHSKEVAENTAKLAKDLNLKDSEVEALYIAGKIHDVGKIGVPGEVLTKPAPLTEEEMKIMKRHIFVGERILKAVMEMEHLIPAILYHHERWDGQGYPQGLKGEEIPLGARILSIVESYHAMISDRPYRKAFSHEEAVSELQRSAGTQFDPALVTRFVNLISLEKEKKAG